TPASPPGRAVLRYAFQFVCFEPAALASALQCASAPSSPPRFAPFPLPVLVTKNVMSCFSPPCCMAEHAANARVAAATSAVRFISPPQERVVGAPTIAPRAPTEGRRAPPDRIPDRSPGGTLRRPLPPCLRVRAGRRVPPNTAGIARGAHR